MSSTSGFNLIATIVGSDTAVDDFLKMQLDSSLFIGEEVQVFDFLESHLEKHGSMPARSTISKETGIMLPMPEEPGTYYLDHVQKRYVQQTLKKSFLEANDYLKSQDPMEALKLMEKTVLDLTMKRNRAQVMNYTTDGYKTLYEYLKQKWLHGEQYGILTGWPTLDNMTYGMVGGDIMAIVGRPASGKTYKMLYMAMKAWRSGKVPMIVSMEMKPLPLIQRLAALHTSIPAKYFKSGELSTQHKKKTEKILKGLEDGIPPFWIIDGNLTASVKDIALLCRQLKPDAVYVDGAYLLKHTDKSSKWERVAGTTEDLKQRVASDLNTPTVASYQFNREQTKVKKVESGLEHIAGSDAIGQIASIVLGFFDEDNPESILQQHVEILKGRNGEIGGFDINWRFEHHPYMDFSEITQQKIENLQFC